ncbi:uncharacterized protein LOC103733112 isoform X1 [Nannospalax galili]|uniref:uncharacterized protein LOC103733112 isoform X1 n=1 Tax=Nannospalax galili TaxID=1026970 RepID=UPI0004ED5FEA|nr:uncharacterized protein LOC103733112 isoform X1 [Nannospalax galili]
MHLFFPQLQRQRAQESPTPPTTKEVLGSQRPLSVFLLNYLVAPLPLKVLFLRDGWAHPSLHLGAKPKRFPPRFSGLFCFFAREVTQVLREFCVQTHEMNFCPSEFEVISEMIFYSSWYRRTFCVISKAQVETKKLTLIKDAFDLRGKQLCAVWNSSPLVSSLSCTAQQTSLSGLAHHCITRTEYSFADFATPQFSHLESSSNNGTLSEVVVDV